MIQPNRLLACTVAALAVLWCAAPNPQQKMDGISMVPALRQSGPLNREAVFNCFPHGGAKAGVTVRAGDWKLICWFDPAQGRPAHELYNLRELDAMIDRFLTETGALAPKPNRNYAQ